MARGLDHVVHAVCDLDAAATRYERWYYVDAVMSGRATPQLGPIPRFY
jgi:hypothetical protein